MTHIFKYFSVCCILIASINDNNVKAMDEELAEYVNNTMYRDQENEYINSLNSDYNNLSHHVKVQLTQINNTFNDAYERDITRIVNENLDSTAVLLKKLINSHKASLYFISSKYKNYALNNICDIYCETYTLDRTYDALKNAKFCRLLAKYHLGLSVILNTFSSLKQKKYNIEHFDQIKNYIVNIKNSMTL